MAELASGYIYYVSLKGVTGSAALDVSDVAEHLARIRRFTDLPLAVGFGIRDAASAQAVAQVADGVVVGSALVSEIERHQNAVETLPAILQAKLQSLRDAMDAG